jgi:arylsulfatase A-like enzyme
MHRPHRGLPRPLALLLAIGLTGLTLPGALGCRGAAAPAPEPPPPTPADLLLVVIDCLRGDALSSAGYARRTTPALDALAGEGTRFTRAFAQASWTRPSLPTLLTGLYPSEHGLLDLGDDNAEHAPALDESVTTLAERLAPAGYTSVMFGEQHKLSPRFGLGQGFARWEHRTGPARNIETKMVEFTAGSPGQRFFAYLHYLELHWPYCPPHDLRGTFDDGTSELDLCADWRRLRDEMRTGEVRLTEADERRMRARYDEELLGVDRELGKLFDQLRQRGVWDETLVVVTADHGEEFGEHGGWFHGHTLHDELIHVPLIVKPPASWGAPRGRTVDALVEQRDLAATLLDAAGVGEAPAGTGSLLPWVRGKEGPARPFVVSESMEQVTVRTAGWKLIAEKAAGALVLYDLAADPGETRDVAAAHADRVGELRRHLVAWRRGLVPAQRREVDVDEETRKGLEGLGYVN